MKLFPILFAAVVVSLSACTTLENRRDLYSPQTVEGPYTRMLRDGIPKPATVEGTVESTTTTSSKNVVR